MRARYIPCQEPRNVIALEASSVHVVRAPSAHLKANQFIRDRGHEAILHLFRKQIFMLDITYAIAGKTKTT